MEKFLIRVKKLMMKKYIYGKWEIVNPNKSELVEYKITYDVDGMIVMAGAN